MKQTPANEVANLDGFRITMLGGRRFNEPNAATMSAAVSRLAAELGADAQQAAGDVAET